MRKVHVIFDHPSYIYIWKHLHVIELHTVFFTIIETTSRKIVIVTLTKAVKRWEYEDIQLQKTS